MKKNDTRQTTRPAAARPPQREHIAVIFAAGRGERFGPAETPKQFREVAGKPVIIHTLERFERHRRIDGIVVVCLESRIPELKRLVERFGISKTVEIVPGGATAWASTYNGVACAARHFRPDAVVLIHDGVRPMIDSETIDRNIDTASACGSCITCTPARENYLGKRPDGAAGLLDREGLLIVRAPQTFRLGQVWALYRRARSEGREEFLDSCSMASHYGVPLHTVTGPDENIKITTPTDLLLFEAMVRMRGNDPSSTSR